MPTIDKGFVLTFGKSISRKASATLDHLAEMDVPAEPFVGFDASESGLVTTHTYELDHPGSGYIIGKKTVNLYLGHVAMWRAAMHCDGEAFLFMEDDVRFRSGWSEEMAATDHALPYDWDMLFIGSCCTIGRSKKRLAGSLHSVSFAMCLHAYMVRKKALRRLINWCQKVDCPIDVTVAVRCMPKLNCFGYLPRLADQPGTEIPE